MMINLLLSTAHEPSYPSVTMSPTILYIFFYFKLNIYEPGRRSSSSSRRVDVEW